MPNRYLKGRARLRKQAATHRRFQEKLKNEVGRLREKLIAAVDNAVPPSAWLPPLSVRLRKFMSRLPHQKPSSKKEPE